MTTQPGLREAAMAGPAALVKAGVSISSASYSATVHQVDRLASWLIPRVVENVVSRVDLTDLVIRHVDLDAVVATVDLDAAVGRVDLLGLAQYVIDGVDLPNIVRSSSASLTTEAVHRLREHGVDADQAVSRVVDRLFLRRHNGNNATPATLPDSV